MWFNRSRIRRVHVCLATTFHRHFWQTDRDLVRTIVVTRDGTDTKRRVSTENWPWRRKFSCRSCQESNLRPFSHKSGALTTDLSSLPKRHTYLLTATIHFYTQPVTVLVWYLERQRMCRKQYDNIVPFFFRESVQLIPDAVSKSLSRDRNNPSLLRCVCVRACVSPVCVCVCVCV